MDKHYNGRMCKVFSCSIMRGHVCCADCPMRDKCNNPCLNHPDRCNLLRSQDDTYQEGPMENPPKPRNKRNRRFTDSQAFALWQAGKSDAEIGKLLGVSRQMICKWRDNMELPATFKQDIDPSQYRLVHNKFGNFVIYDGE